MPGLINMGARQQSTASRGLNNAASADLSRRSTNNQFAMRDMQHDQSVRGLAMGMQAMGDDRFHDAAQKLMRSRF